MRNFTSRFLLAGSIALTMGFTGCATMRVVEPIQPVAAEAPLRAAEELGSAKVPTAELHASYARDELKAAKKAQTEGDDRRSHLLTRRAQLDAELALLITKRSTAVSAADEALLKIEPTTTAN